MSGVDRLRPYTDLIQCMIGEMARPFALYAVSFATAKAIWLHAPADVVGAAGAVTSVLYGAKAYEAVQAKKQDANVQIAQAATPPSGP